jgi:fatty-acyl-CoA synthase
MASIELGFGTLLLGGKVVVMDGPDLPTICDYLEREPLSNLIFFPGMVEQTIAYLKERKPRVRSLKKFGALADLWAPKDIAQLTSLLDVPFTNTFGSTETGMPPLSAGRLAKGIAPTDFGKLPSSLCEVRVCADDDSEAPIGEPGELAVRGPTVFSGYWGAPEATAEALRGGWYRTGDMFRRRADGRYDYVDRRKYLIKSGGENIYPAEIERVVMQHPAIADAIVVRQPDARWGEVPVLVAIPRDTPPAEAVLMALCAESLAPFKRPKAVLFAKEADVPRSGTGKIIRAEVEAWVATALAKVR